MLSAGRKDGLFSEKSEIRQNSKLSRAYSEKKIRRKDKKRRKGKRRKGKRRKSEEKEKGREGKGKEREEKEREENRGQVGKSKIKNAANHLVSDILGLGYSNK